MPDWFRSPYWDDTARADFERRLARARATSRPQYLRIKGLALSRVKEVDGARELWRRVLADDSEFAHHDHGYAAQHLADSYAADDPTQAARFRELAEELLKPSPALQEQERRSEQIAAHAHAASRPLLDDLAAAGVDVDDVWHLYRDPDARLRATPVLLNHLARDYPDRLLEGIGMALDHRGARPWWTDIVACYRSDSRPVVRERLASVLATCGKREHYDDLLDLVRDESLGSSRILLLRTVHRIGNRISSGQGRAVIATLATHPSLGIEATAILEGRSVSE